MRKISVSFLSSKNIAEDLNLLDYTDADFIHVDVMDGKFVKNKSLPFREMKHIHKYTKKRLDVHLMVENPSKYIPLYAELNVEYITFHIETEEDVMKNLNLIRDYSVRCGLALCPDTPVKSLIPYLPYLDVILIMSVVPGEGGQEFIPSTEQKLVELHSLLQSYDLNVSVNVDGGVNDETSKKCRYVDILTSGSYILSGESYQDKITSLR